MSGLKLTLFILICMSLSMCLEPFQFEVDADFSLVVVDGDFTTAGDTHSLRISTTLNYGKKFLQKKNGMCI